MQLTYTAFDNQASLEASAYDLLAKTLCEREGAPRGVMLTGGSTPFGVYERLAASGLKADPEVTVLISDERYVPIDSVDSNFGRMRPMLSALGVDKALHVDSSVPVAIAAERYANALAEREAAGMDFGLGILGLGADGHVAALFNREQIESGQGRLAVAVNRPDGMTGISVTPHLLCQFKRLVFWVCGEAKQDAVEALRNDPSRIPAGIALDAAPHVELWYAPTP